MLVRKSHVQRAYTMKNTDIDVTFEITDDVPDTKTGP